MNKIIILLLSFALMQCASALEIVEYQQTEIGYADGQIVITGIDGLSGDLIVEIGIKGGEGLDFDIARTSDDVVTARIFDKRYIENDTFLVVSSMAGAERRLKMFKVKGAQKIAQRKKERKVTENNQHPDIVSLADGETVEVKFNPTNTTLNQDGTLSTKTEVEQTAKVIDPVAPNVKTTLEEREPVIEVKGTPLEIDITGGRTYSTVGEFAELYQTHYGYKLIKLPGDEMVLNLPLKANIDRMEDLYAATDGAVRHVILHHHTNPKLMRILPSVDIQDLHSNAKLVALIRSPEIVGTTVREILSNIPETKWLSPIEVLGHDQILNTVVDTEKPIENIDELYAVTKEQIKHVIIAPPIYRVIGY